MPVANLTCEQCGELMATGTLRCPRCGQRLPVANPNPLEGHSTSSDRDYLTNSDLLSAIDPTREPWPEVRGRLLIILALAVAALVASIVFVA